MKYLLVLVLFLSTFYLSAQVKWNDQNMPVKMKDSLTIVFDGQGSIQINTNSYGPLDNDTIQFVINKVSKKIAVKKNGNALDSIASFANQFIIAFGGITKNIKIEDIIDPCQTIRVRPEINIYDDAYLLDKYRNCDQIRGKILAKYTIKPDNVWLTDITRLGTLESSEPAKYSAQQNGIDITRFADGLVKHIIAQFKQELTTCFFNDFKTELKKSEYRDARVLFSHTYEELDLIDSKIYNFQPYVSSLRSNMEIDFMNMDRSLYTLVQDTSSQVSKLLNKERNTLFLTKVGFDFYNAVRDSVHIGRALHQMDLSIGTTTNTDSVFIAAFQTLQLFSMAFKDTLDGRDDAYWVSQDKIDALLKNEDFLETFIGLITAQSEGINLKKRISLYSFLNNKSTYEELRIAFAKFKSIYTKIEAQKKSLKRNFGETINQHIKQYFEMANELIASFDDLNKLLKWGVTSDKVTKYTSIANDIAGLFENVYAKQYTSASLHLSNLVSTYSNNGKNDLSKLADFLIKKGVFIAQMADAKSGDEVAAVLEAYAAPLGSWRDKIKSPSVVAIDSYIGLGRYFQSDYGNKYGVSTPIGLSLSFSLGKKVAFTALGSIIDLGPLTAYRFQNDDLGTAKIYLKEILAPGLHGMLLIPICDCAPLTLNVGYQQFTLLNQVGLTINDVYIEKNYGWVAGISYNVPLYTLSR